MLRALNLNRVEWEEPTQNAPPSPARIPAQEPPTTATEDLTIRQRPPRVSTVSPLQSPQQTKQQSSGVWRPRANQTEVVTPTTSGPPKKNRRINCVSEESSQVKHVDQTREERSTPAVTTHLGILSLIGKLKHGQKTQISEDEVLGYKDLPMEAYEFSALLRLGTTYELMDFLARAQVVVVARMAEEHAETKMIQ